jgi:hypothetical protein
MNRVIHYLKAPCASCRQLNEIERRLELVKAEVERIESAVGDKIVEFWVPSAERVLHPRDDDEPGVKLLVSYETRFASLDEDLADYAATEMKRVAALLWDAANRIEKSAS